MSRRVIDHLGNWDEMRGAFRWDIPEHFNIAERCCDSWAEGEPDRVAIVQVSQNGSLRNWTYGEIKDASDRLAQSLAARGVARGDRVAVLLAQSPEVLITHFAAMKLGAVVLPLFTLFGSDALRYRLADSGARVVVTDAGNLVKVDALTGALPDLETVYSIDGTSGSTLSFWDEVDAMNGDFSRVETLADDPAVMIYTSGTTGPPKGVLHAHRFLIGHLPSIETTHYGLPQGG